MTAFLTNGRTPEAGQETKQGKGEKVKEKKHKTYMERNGSFNILNFFYNLHINLGKLFLRQDTSPINNKTPLCTDNNQMRLREYRKNS